MPLAAKRVSPDATEILDELLINQVAGLGKYQVIGASDINAMLGLEKMKEALGCDDIACAAEIGGALGVGRLLAGSVSSLGGVLYAFGSVYPWKPSLKITFGWVNRE